MAFDTQKFESLQDDLQSGLCALPIKSLMLWEDLIPYPLYIRLGETKFIKVVNPHDYYLDTLNNYYERGIKSVWLEKEDFDILSKKIREKISKEVSSNEELRFEYVFSELNTSYDLFQEIAISSGLNQEHLELVNEMGITVLQELKGQRDFLQRFLSLKKNCNEMFLINTYTGYISSMLALGAPWNSPSMSKALMTASILADIYLTPEELNDHIKWERNELSYSLLSSKVKVHSDVVSVKLKESKKFELGQDVLQVIRYHHNDHELNPKLADQAEGDTPAIAAIYIVARKVAHSMFNEGSNFNITPLIKHIHANYNRGPFRAVAKAVDTFWRYEIDN